MVFFTLNIDNVEEMVSYFLDKGIKINPPENGMFRFVTNYWVTKRDIDYIIKTLKDFLSLKAR